MIRLALACAVMLASLFTVAAQADAAGFKRYKPHVVQHTVRKHQIHKAQKRFRAIRRFRLRFFANHHRRGHPYHFARRYR